MSISVEAYVELRKAELDEFAKDWRVCMENDPVCYDFDQASEGVWREQEEAYQSMKDDK